MQHFDQPSAKQHREPADRHERDEGSKLPEHAFADDGVLIAALTQCILPPAPVVFSSLADAKVAFHRSTPVHLTGSALIIHPTSSRVLLRFHPLLNGWYQVGGHMDVGETDPFMTALREAREETGMTDLYPMMHNDQPVVLQAVFVRVPESPKELAHEHLDVRYLLGTNVPETVIPESPAAELRWLSIADACAICGDDALREAIRAVQPWMGNVHTT